MGIEIYCNGGHTIDPLASYMKTPCYRFNLTNW